MIHLEFKNGWNLRYTEYDFNRKWLTEDGFLFLQNLLNKFPLQKEKILSFSGNIPKGNIIFNEIIDVLFEANRISSKCQRINILEDNSDLVISSLLDVVLIDNIDFEYMSKNSIESLLNLQDFFMKKSLLLILNISSLDSKPPKIFKDTLEIITNIGIK